MSNQDLIIIEAPGKLRRLRAVLNKLGVEADICATIGHFLENPTDLRDVGVVVREGRFEETKRTPHRQAAYAHLCAAIARCSGRVIVATDNDAEGHVIARDIAVLAKDRNPTASIFRAIFNALDVQSVRNALSAIVPIDLSAGDIGDARRITDRLIAARCSNFELGLPVGRVQSGILSLCAKGIPHGVVRQALPAAVGRSPFLGAISVTGATTPAELLAELGEFKFLPVDTISTQWAPLAELPTYDQVLLDIHGKLGVGIIEASNLLQKMYEDGEISYPRSASRVFSSGAADRIGRLASLKGIQSFKRNNLPVVSSPSELRGHDPVHIVSDRLLQRLDLGKPLGLHDDFKDAAAALIARRSIEAGVQVIEEYPQLKELAAWAQDVGWYRIKSMPPLPWARPTAWAEAWSPQASILRAMVAQGIGRPSTWAAHAERAVAHGLVDAFSRLTPRGELLRAQAPSGLQKLECAGQLEAVLSEPLMEEDGRNARISECLRLAVGEGERAAIEKELEVAGRQSAADAPREEDKPPLAFYP